MTVSVVAEPLTAEAFAPYGDVLQAPGAPDKIINQVRCGRFHDRVRPDFGPGGRTGLAVFPGDVVAWPVDVASVERHPEGGQSGTPQSFAAAPGRGVNFHRATWHGVSTPLDAAGLFAVVDRIGDGPNLEEYRFDASYWAEPGQARASGEAGSGIVKGGITHG